MAPRPVVWNPDVMNGKPVLAGTRISVESILERIAVGETIADIVASHPLLTEEDVRQLLPPAPAKRLIR